MKIIELFSGIGDKMIGNAVSVPVVKEIAKRMKENDKRNKKIRRIFEG